MGFFSRAPCWLVRVVGYASFLAGYAIVSLAAAITYPSVRFANPVDIGGGILLSDGDVYSGNVTYLGLPLRFVTWRDEAVEPRHDAPKKTVAVHVSAVATALDVGFVISLLVIAAKGGYRYREMSPRERWALFVAVAIVCGVLVLAVTPIELLEPIDPYAS